MDLKKVKEKLVGFYKSKKKLVLIGGGALVLVIAAAVFFTSRSASTSEETTVQYVKVTTGSLTESIDVVGTLEAQPMVELTWESGGIISPFSFKVGGQVKKGDILLSLEDSSLSSSILQAQTDLLDAKATLDNLKSANTDLYTASQTLSDAEYTLRQYDSNRDYWNVKGSSWDAIEESRADYYAAKQVVYEKDSAYKVLIGAETTDEAKKAAAYKDYQDAVAAREKALRVLNNLLGTYYSYAADTDFILYDQAKAAVEEARIDYNRYLDQTDEIAAAEANVQALENSINQSNIVAPFNGTITEISAVSGQKVASGDTAVRIDNLSNLVVDVAVSEVDINKVSEGQKAIVTFDALPDNEYKGKVASISSAGSDDSGVVEFSVTVKVMNADENVKPGFTAVVSIITSEVKDALLVPNGAVVSRDGSSAVILVGSDNSTVIVPVETGASSDTFTEIVGGDIAEGNTLAVYATGSNSQFMMGGFGIMGGGGGTPPQGERPQGERPQQ